MPCGGTWARCRDLPSCSRPVLRAGPTLPGSWRGLDAWPLARRSPSFPAGRLDLARRVGRADH
eukprot:12965690-Alexandrium_andersonii.AAC.1